MFFQIILRIVLIFCIVLSNLLPQVIDNTQATVDPNGFIVSCQRYEAGETKETQVDQEKKQEMHR